MEIKNPKGNFFIDLLEKLIKTREKFFVFSSGRAFPCVGIRFSPERGKFKFPLISVGVSERGKTIKISMNHENKKNREIYSRRDHDL